MRPAWRCHQGKGDSAPCRRKGQRGLAEIDRREAQSLRISDRDQGWQTLPGKDPQDLRHLPRGDGKGLGNLAPDSMKRISFFFVLSLTLFIPAQLPAASWLELRSSHFIMRYQEPERKMASFLLQRAEKTREATAQAIGTVPPSPSLIYLAPSWEAFQGLQPSGEPPSWSVGTAYPALNLIILRSPRGMKGGETDIEEVLQHEY